jgi:predicted RecA/RadA family phage recombinase
MAKNYKQPGNVIDITAGANLTSGTPVVVGTLLAVPLTDIANGDVGAAQIEGVFELPKLGTAVITAGAKLIWDVSAGQFIIASAATGDLDGCAVAIAAAGNGTTTVLAKLLPGNATVTA